MGWKWWKKYKAKKALKKKREEEPDIQWIPRRFGDKIILCPRFNPDKDDKMWI